MAEQGRKRAAKASKKEIKSSTRDGGNGSLLAQIRMELGGVGVTDEEFTKIIKLGLTYLVKLPEAQEQAMRRDNAQARASHSMAVMAESIGKLARVLTGLLGFVADMADKNQNAVRAAFGAKIWNEGLKAAAGAAATLQQDVHKAVAEWTETAQAASTATIDASGTKPVERPHKHKPHKDKGQLKASVAEHVKAKQADP